MQLLMHVGAVQRHCNDGDLKKQASVIYDSWGMQNTTLCSPIGDHM